MLNRFGISLSAYSHERKLWGTYHFLFEEEGKADIPAMITIVSASPELVEWSGTVVDAEGKPVKDRMNKKQPNEDEGWLLNLHCRLQLLTILPLPQASKIATIAGL